MKCFILKKDKKKALRDIIYSTALVLITINTQYPLEQSIRELILNI